MCHLATLDAKPQRAGTGDEPRVLLPVTGCEQEETQVSKLFRSSRPDGWIVPRSYSDPSFRAMTHGKILPMEEPGFLERLFGRR